MTITHIGAQQGLLLAATYPPAVDHDGRGHVVIGDNESDTGRDASEALFSLLSKYQNF